MLAYRLHLPIKAVEAMRTTEFMEWLAFFEIQSEMSKQHGKVR